MSWARYLVATTCLVLALAGSGGCATHNANLEPQADEALRQMSNLLAETQGFSVHSTATMEERLESGQLAQFARDSRILVRRPDRMYAEVHRGPVLLRIWYQGKTLTLLDVNDNCYTEVAAPDRIDRMLDFMADEYDLVFPLADLLFPDPYAVLTEQVIAGTYVDEQEVGETLCHHLLFTQDNLDWQIWIDAGKKPVPRRIVITYLEDEDAPQFDGILDDWQLATPDEKEFIPELPPDAKLLPTVEFLTQEEGS